MTDPPAATLTIRAFATLSRLSVKALRLYDELNLLPPARVDAQNGYTGTTRPRNCPRRN